MEEAKIIYPCGRFDLKSRRSISREQKYYLADPGFYYAMNTDKRVNLPCKDTGFWGTEVSV